ncbi:MAG: ParB/RepB/Spo0J family partition protein [Desulfobulbaceae bacterium]|nr:ParB/RepB/Spo0J family partition protein [Desulfobulbaceae bacterium]
MAKHSALGQGVSLLFGDTPDENKFFRCNIEHIQPNRFQPRLRFDDELLTELADSIRENGVIQPLIVKKTNEPDCFELVAGERRLRAAKIAGLNEIPVVVMEIDRDDHLLELALIENVQRTDLNAIEEAEAYQKLINSFGYTQEETAKRVGKKRSTITNMLRLLNLPENIKQDVVDAVLSEGHARALLRLVDEPELLKKIRDEVVLKHLSVRQTEKLVKKESLEPSPPEEKKNETDPKIIDLTNKIYSRFGTSVKISQNRGRGRIEIEYSSPAELDRLCGLLLNN